MDGPQLARVPDQVIAEIRSRERAGLIELPRLRVEPGARVRVLQGALHDQIGLLAALRPHERVLVLLRLLGGAYIFGISQFALRLGLPED